MDWLDRAVEKDLISSGLSALKAHQNASIGRCAGFSWWWLCCRRPSGAQRVCALQVEGGVGAFSLVWCVFHLLCNRLM